jgi:uncharacterized protein involved in outer membrane biogenesis
MHQSGRHRGRVAIIATLSFFAASAVALWATGKLDGRLDWRSAAFWAGLRDSYKLDAPIQLVAEPPMTLERGTVSLANSSGKARSLDTVADVVAGGGTEMALSGALLTIDLRDEPQEREASQPSFAFNRMMMAIKQLKFSAVAINSSKIVVRRANGKSDVFSDVIGELNTNSSNGVDITLAATLRDERMNLDASITPALSDGTSASRLPLRASVRSDRLQASFDGRLALGKTLKIDAQRAELSVPDVREAADWLEIALPDGGGFRNFRAKGQAEWSEGSVAFENATIEMDGNSGYGALSLDFSKGRPAIDGTLAFATLDLTPYFPNHANAAEHTPSGSDAWIPLALASDLMSGNFLDDLQADLRVSADAIRLGDAAMRRSAASVAIKDGKLQADIAELELEGNAHGSGELLVDMSQHEPHINVRGKIENVDLGAMTASVMKHPVLAGRGDVTVDLTSGGVEQSAFLETLNGKITLSLADEGQLGVDVEALAQGAKAVSSASADPSAVPAWTAADGNSVPVTQLDASFNVANGKLLTEKFAAVTADRTVSANGAVDLPGATVEMTISLAPNPPPAPPGQSSGIAMAPATPSDVVKVTGPWSAPMLAPGAQPRKADLPQPSSGTLAVQ